MTAGDVDELRELLAADVEVYGDGGGKAPQWMRVVVGVEKVARMFAGLSHRFADAKVEMEPHEVNGQPGAVIRDGAGRVVNVLTLDVLDGRIQVIRSVINPDKLRHLGPVADAWALMRESSPGGVTPSVPGGSAV